MSGRCMACDRKLSEYEMTRKFIESGTYVGLCTKCFNSGIYPPVKDRPDLMRTEDVDDDIQEEPN